MNLLLPDELRILYVWVEVGITIEIVGARELIFFFSTQEKMSHTPTQNTASLVLRCRWRSRYLGLFTASQHLCNAGKASAFSATGDSLNKIRNNGILLQNKSLMFKIGSNRCSCEACLLFLDKK